MKTLNITKSIVSRILVGAITINLLGILFCEPLTAQTYTWNNASGGEWTNINNWTPSTNYPRNSSGVTASFENLGTGSTNIAVTMASGVTTMGAQTVSFSGDDNYTLGATNGGKLRLAGTTQLVSAIGTGANSINAPLTFGIQSSSSGVTTTISNASTGVLTINRLEGLGTGADHQLVVTGSGNTVFSTGVVNPGAQTISLDVVKTGTGTLTFSTAPGSQINQGITINGGAVALSAVSTNYTGGTTINDSGRLVVGTNNAIDAATLTLNSGGILQLGNAGSGSVIGAITNNGTVTFNFASGTSVTNVISGSGRVLHEQGQRVTLSGDNTYSGGTRISSSGANDVYLGVTSDGNLGNVSGALTFAGTGRGTLRIDAAGFSSARSIVLEGSGGRLAVGSAGDTALFSGSISGAGGLVAGLSSGNGGNTNGVITLSGALSYSGPTTVAFGTLVVSNTAGTTNLLSGGFATGSGAFVKDGAGVLDVAGGNAATGSLTIRGGTLRTAGATNIYGSGNITITNGAVLEATESFTLGRRLIVGSADGGTNSVGVVSVAEGRAVTFNAGGGGVGGIGQLIKSGSGTLILASSNNINNGTSAAMVLQAGTLAVTNTGTLGNPAAARFAMSGGKLDLGSTTQTLLGFTATGGSVANGVINNTGNYDFTAGAVSAVLAGSSANLVKNGPGTLTLSGANTYSGSTTINAGSLVISGNGSVGNSSLISVSSGAVLDVSGVNGGFKLVAGQAIGGGGDVFGDLSFESGANFVFSLNQTLTVNSGTVSFENFGFSNLAGFDSSVELGTYKLMDGTATFNFANISNFGADNAYDLGGGKFAYFSEGSLEVIVVPEPSAFALLLAGGSVFLIKAVRARRRRVRGWN